MNENFLQDLFQKNKLEFTSLCTFTPCLYVRLDHPLAESQSIAPSKLKDYPCVRFEQGHDRSQFSEELLLSDPSSRQSIYVTDRSTLFSVIRATDAYTIARAISPQPSSAATLRPFPLPIP